MSPDLEKFSSQMDPKILSELRKYSREANIRISDILNEAVSTHLERLRVRPAFRNAVDHILNENEDLLKRLAR